MADWRRLANELDHWSGDGLVATLWWRDDDAARPAPELDRLLETRARAGVPLALAVIPASVEASAAERINGGCTVLQHGYAHRNHAPANARKAELGAGRSVGEAISELATGQQRLAALFGAAATAVLVPPWNRIGGGLVAALGDAGFTGLSTWGPRAQAWPAPGIGQVNTHVDIVDWRGTRGFAGEEAVLGATVAHLRARRKGVADRAEPTGLLTHHLVHDEAGWRFIEAFVERTRAHPAAHWLDAAAAFGATSCPAAVGATSCPAAVGATSCPAAVGAT